MSAAPHDPLFQSAFTHAAIGMALVGLDGRWLRVNRSICEIVGYSSEELLASSFQTVTHPDDLELDLAYVGQMLRGEIDSYQMEKRYLHRKGQIVWCLLSVSLVRGEKGEPLFFISQVQDISARKEAELMREALFQLPAALHFVAGFDGFFRRLSPSWSQVLGYPEEELLGMTMFSLVHPEDAQKTMIEFARSVRGLASTLFENRLRHADGAYRWILWNFVSLPERKLTCGVAVDYTRRKEIELALERALAEKEALVTEAQTAARAVQSLRDQLLTVCAWTKRIRYKDQWISTDEFLRVHLKLNVTHGISEEAMERIFSEDGSHAA